MNIAKHVKKCWKLAQIAKKTRTIAEASNFKQRGRLTFKIQATAKAKNFHAKSRAEAWNFCAKLNAEASKSHMKISLHVRLRH